MKLGTVTTIEEGARWRKVAHLLAAVLVTQGGDVGATGSWPAIFEDADDAFWTITTQLAALPYGPSDETKQLIVDLVRSVGGTA